MADKKLNRIILVLLVTGLFVTLCVNGAVAAARARAERARSEKEAETALSAELSETLDAAGESSRLSSGVSTEGGVVTGPGAADAIEQSDYYSGSRYEEFQKKFSDTEDLLSRMRTRSSSEMTETERRSEASSELRYWETQMNALYQTLMEILPDEKAAVLSRDQQDWQKKRESAAAEASKNNSSDQSSGTEYILSEAESTRTRAYELLEKYKSELSVLQ